ncbi:MAG: hypothetical protein Q4G27_01060 [Flavobacteriaceae bacterium]|nr:hypothetical protein [Flavobacteriaceae bacterium]
MNEEHFTPEYNRDYVSRVFRDRASADRAFDELESRGYTKDEINVMLSDRTRDEHFGNESIDSELGDKVAENAGKGSLIGGGIGATIGAIAAIGSNVIFPGLGLVVAGPLAAGLAGAGAGAATGGLIGALTGAGVPEDEATRYKDEIQDGGIYMGFKPRNEEEGRELYDRWYSDEF